MSWFLMNNKKKEEKRSSEIKKQYLRCVKESCKYKKLEKIPGLWAKTLTESWQRTSGWMYLCRPTYKILSEYASLSLFHIFHFHSLFHVHFFSFSLGAGQRTKLWRSLLHFHTCILRIFAFSPKFGNSPILEELCHAPWQFGFLQIKSCIAEIFNLIILTTHSSKMIIMFFNLIFILIESNLAGMRSRRCLPAPQTRWMDNYARKFSCVSCFVVIWFYLLTYTKRANVERY